MRWFAALSLVAVRAAAMTVSGTVTGPSGPLSGVTVQIIVRELPSLREIQNLQLTTAADGRFEQQTSDGELFIQFFPREPSGLGSRVGCSRRQKTRVYARRAARNNRRDQGRSRRKDSSLVRDLTRGVPRSGRRSETMEVRADHVCGRPVDVTFVLRVSFKLEP